GIVANGLLPITIAVSCVITFRDDGEDLRRLAIHRDCDTDRAIGRKVQRGAERKAGSCLTGREEVDAVVQMRTADEALHIEGSLGTHAVLFYWAESGLPGICFRREVAGIDGDIACTFGETGEVGARQV